jgi:predicted CXXCH cytochrome family protein
VRVFVVTLSFLIGVLLAARVCAQQAMLTKDSKRECATCHLDWVDSFDRPGAVLLMDRPTRPAAAAEETCRGCHDGAVGDSRRGVWLEHGHRMNDPPTDRIKVPPHMPLEDGKMVCRTCHTAHTVPTAADLSKIVFLRAAKEGGLCQQCHVDRAYGAEHTSHPLAKLPFELPAELADAHARTDIADRTKMACQTCHTTHGARADHLLVMGTSSGQLCVACHEKLRPTEWKADAPREHPQNPPLRTVEQRRAIADMGTRLGPGDTLTCFSCHKMHAARTGKYMLAETLEESRLCVRCHEDRTPMAASPHDLRTNKPLEKNRLGQTPGESGPCGACHSFHRYARDPKPGRGDPSGRCTTCHESVAKVGAGDGLPLAHPVDVAAAKAPSTATLKLVPQPGDEKKASFTCNTCHDPHLGGEVAKFLRMPKDTMCASCHADRAASLAGKHDFSDRPDLKNGRGQTAAESGKCAFCHAVHAKAERVMWVATKESPGTPDELCTQCHREGGLAGRMPGAAFGHPTGPKARPTTRAALPLPLFNNGGSIVSDGFVACASCHDPHGDTGKRPTMLRAGGATSELCTTCHAANAAMTGGPHDLRGKKDVPAGDAPPDLCTSCHRPHADDPVKQRLAFAPAAGMPRPDGACVACHAKQGWGNEELPPAGRSLHPTALPAKHAGSEAGLPLLVGADGEKSLACKTCHDPHARVGTPKMARATSGATMADVCVRCHKAAEPLPRGMHADDALQSRNPPAAATTCGPCHATHAVEGSQRRLLWAAKAKGWDTSDPDQRCLSCHEINPPGRRMVVSHPAEPLAVVPWADGTEKGKAVPAEIRCSTCHTTHGEPSARSVPDLDARRAARPMLRPDVARQCAYCHGQAAPQLLLYWHAPDRRTKLNPLPVAKPPDSQN